MALVLLKEKPYLDFNSLSKAIDQEENAEQGIPGINNPSITHLAGEQFLYFFQKSSSEFCRLRDH
jgi:hypothetical protein